MIGTIQIFLILVVYTFCSCSLSPLESALRESGKNREELEKVLKHYSSKKDSLKLEAAIFLITNMPEHYSLSGKQLDEYNQTMDSLYLSFSSYRKFYEKTIPNQHESLRESLHHKHDINNITSEFLISHIDYMFSQKAKRPWLKYLSFEDFCEYVLPYRIDIEDLYSLTTHMQNTDVKHNDSLLLYYDDLKYYARNAMKFVYGIREKHIEKPVLVTSYFNGRLQKNEWTCLETTRYQWIKCKFHLLPAVFDYIPFFPHKNNRHYWLGIIDNSYKNHFISEYIPERAARVYRKTYSRQPTPKPTNDEYVPEFFSTNFQKNVTGSYFPVSDLNVSLLPENTKNRQYAYLAVFNELQWQPIAFAKIKHDKVIFNDMGRGIVYLPIVYHNNRPVPASFPLLLKDNGEIQKLVADTTRKQTMTFTRKFPTNSRFSCFDEGLVGACIEASNNKDFTRTDTLATINSYPYPGFNEIRLSTKKSYRYWRLLLPKGQTTSISELEFITSDSVRVQQGAILNDSTSSDTGNVFDQDPLSYSDINCWMGMDFGKPVRFSHIRYLARNDANNIFSDEVYELFYLTPQGWISLGRQVAYSEEITYNNIPANALLWLRDINKGREERIFTIENGEIKFW